MSKQLSIIIPIYNVEKYIQTCLLSVYAADIPDVEIILVDDGSTDQSARIMKEFHAKYPEQTICISQANGGLSNARNTGLSVATGTYIAFLDSDDFISPEGLAALFQLTKKYDLDIAIGDFIQVDEAQNNLIPVEPAPLEPNQIKITTGIIDLEQRFTGNQIDVTVWRCLYKKQFLDQLGLTFVDRLIHEDILFTFHAFTHAKRVAYIPIPFYFYRQRAGSIMRTPNQKSFQSKLYIANVMQTEIDTHKIDSKAWQSIALLLYANAVRVGKLKNKQLSKKLKANKRLSLFAQFRKATLPWYEQKARETKIESP